MTDDAVTIAEARRLARLERGARWLAIARGVLHGELPADMTPEQLDAQEDRNR